VIALLAHLTPTGYGPWGDGMARLFLQPTELLLVIALVLLAVQSGGPIRSSAPAPAQPHNGGNGSSGSLPGGNEESPVGSRFVLRRVRRCPAAVMGAPAPSARTLAVLSPSITGADRISR
jgi:hypothetical protein